MGYSYKDDVAGSKAILADHCPSAHFQNAFFILMLAAWGCIGITQTSFGFHNVWEFWAYQAFYGIFVCPWYAISVRMMFTCCYIPLTQPASDDLRSRPSWQRGKLFV